MNIKKLVSMVLLGSLALGSLASCAENGDVRGADATDESETVGSSVVIEPEAPAWNDDGVLRILTIGNSFSDDTMEYVYQIAKSAGVAKIELGNLYIGGCTLATHASNAKNDKPAYEYRTNTRGSWSTKNNFKMSDAIKSQNWDFISMQQASGSSGSERSYKELEYLIGYVRSLANPDATLVWNMTWAYQQDSTHSEFPVYNSDQITMYESILSAVKKRVDKQPEIKIVSPTGTAIQNARTSFVGDRLTRDGYHLSLDLGRYIAGLTFFSALTGVSVENLDYAPAGVSNSLKKVALESALNAIRSPRAVTRSAFTTDPS